VDPAATFTGLSQAGGVSESAGSVHETSFPVGSFIQVLSVELRQCGLHRGAQLGCFDLRALQLCVALFG